MAGRPLSLLAQALGRSSAPCASSASGATPPPGAAPQLEPSRADVPTAGGRPPDRVEAAGQSLEQATSSLKKQRRGPSKGAKEKREARHFSKLARCTFAQYPNGEQFPCLKVCETTRKLGCRACEMAYKAGAIKETKWATCQVPGVVRGKALQAERIKRHFNVSQSQLGHKVPLDKVHQRAMGFLNSKMVAGDHHFSETAAETAAAGGEFAAPTCEQIRILVELVWGVGGNNLSDFPKRCNTAREQGANVPNLRCSRQVATKLLHAAAETEFEVDRTGIIPNATEFSWAQDKASYGPMMQKYRSVSRDFKVHSRMIDYFEPRDGDKAVDECLDMKLGLQRLCSEPFRARCDSAAASQRTDSCAAAARPQDGEPEQDAALPTDERFDRVCAQPIFDHFVQRLRNANADGASVAQLALRFAKASY
jgi:hypothetical protein